MTIVEPKKVKSKVKFILPLVLVLAAGSFGFISLHGNIVDIRYRLIREEKKIEQLKVTNAELENRIYGILDADALTRAASELGLILEKRPKYLEFGNVEQVSRL